MAVLGGEVPKIEKASPVAAQEAEGLIPVLFAQFKMSAFRGADPAQTKLNIEAFVRRVGHELLSYQDNEAGRHMNVVAPVVDGMVARLSRYFLVRDARAKLNAHPEVENARETARGDLSVLFTRPLYEDRIQAIIAILPEGLRVERYRNKLMEGIWVDLSTAGMDDPKAVAEALASAYPAEIDWVQAVVKVPTFRTEVR